VADWRPDTVGEGKLKKKPGGPPTIALVENPDILATLSRGAKRPKLVVGFAAETHDLMSHAKAKLKRKGCDLIVANDVAGDGAIGAADNAVTLISASGSESWPRQSKEAVARRLAELIAQELK
jgi:phosphopantothenoylcysteine decarboxylase/phosphopantothenate--cysteine ligase